MDPKTQTFLHLIERFPKTKILVIGDLMVDRFVRGKVSRISPEAPVPVVQVKEETDLPGGAGNVIMNLSALNSQVICCGVIGPDINGQNLLRRFQNQGIKTEGIIADSARSTTVKTRVIAEHQQVVRFDYEDTHDVSPSVEKEIQRFIENTISNVDGVILSDYGKGVIIKPILTQTIACAKKFKKPICVDPKIEHFLFYKKVTCITPNLAEAMGGMHRTRLNGKEDVTELGRAILKKLGAESVLITRGEDGMTLFERNKITHIPAKAQEVYDVTGAGDTVISVLTLALACGASLIHAAALSNIAAGIVVGKLGTATVSPDELKTALRQ